MSFLRAVGLATLTLIAATAVRAQPVVYLSGPSLDSMAVHRLRLDRPGVTPEVLTDAGVYAIGLTGRDLLYTLRPQSRAGLSVALYGLDLSPKKPGRPEQLRSKIGSPLYLRPSPDGHSVAVDNVYTQRTRILPLVGDSSLELSIPSGMDPQWLPDGSGLVLMGRVPETPTLGYDLFYVSASGDQVLDLTRAPGDETLPLISPDGRRVAYAADESGNREVMTIGIDGVGRRSRVPSPGDDRPVVWIDSETLIVRSERSGQAQFYRLNLVDDALTPLTSLPVPVGTDVTLDGRWLVFTAGPEGKEQLWALRLDQPGAPPTLLTSGAGRVRSPLLGK